MISETAPVWLLLLACIYFFLPAGVANMAPVFLTKITGKQGAPIDGGRQWRGVRLFGAHKSWRGLLAGAIAGGLFFLLQAWLYRFPAMQRVSIIDYSTAPLLLGAALGLGALLGDLAKSFFKRQAKVAPGTSWIPFDQIDYVVGALLLSLPFVRLRPIEYAVIVGLFFVLHFAVNIIGWALGIKENVL